MANRTYNRTQAIEKEVKFIYANISIGASGAPTLNSTKSKGVASVARTAAGDYTLTLSDKYDSLLHAQVSHLEAGDEDLTFQIASETVSSAKEVKIICKAAAIATDPSNGSVLLVKLDLKNSVV